MGRINLVIGDIDADYLENLSGYIAEHYARRFQVDAFTSPASLAGFLSSCEKAVDILLADPVFLAGSLPLSRVKTLILLTQGRLLLDMEQYHRVHKLQNIDTLISSLLCIYNQENKSEILIPGGNRKTRVIAVYSPVGGVGKTSIAEGCSIQCAENGQAVFYLNLEGMDSSSRLFKSQAEQNLSHVIYHLKGKSINFALKMEGIRCMDPDTGVHFFAPADCSLEMEELLPEEFNLWIQEIRGSSLYDVLYIDMPSHFDKNCLAVLEAADQVLLVTTEEEYACLKTCRFLKELELFCSRNGKTILQKVIQVTNKKSSNPSDACEGEDGSGLKGLSLPWIPESSGSRLQRNPSFCRGIQALVKAAADREA